MKVFDWTKAAGLIRERQPSVAEAGLIEDWNWTGGEIYKDGKVVSKDDTYTYLASTWATPVLYMDEEMEECWVMEESTDWDARTYWPQEALDILEGEQE